MTLLSIYQKVSVYLTQICSRNTPLYYIIVYFQLWGFCFFHTIFSSFGFLYFGHFIVAWFSFRFLSVLPLQNTNKDYIIFLYFHDFVAKSNQKQKNEKMGWTKQKMQRCRNPTTLNSLKSVLQNCRLLFFSLDWSVTKYQTLNKSFCCCFILK